MWLKCERIKFFFFFSFFFFFHGFFYFLVSLPFRALGKIENVLFFLATTLRECKKSTMLTLELIKKWGSWCAFNKFSILRGCIFHSHKISTRTFLKTMKINKKLKNEQPWTLAYTSILKTMSSPFSCFLGSRPIAFPSKVMPCNLNHNLICLSLGLLSKVALNYKALDVETIIMLNYG